MSIRHQVLSKGLPPTSSPQKRLPLNRDLSPLKWSEFFDSKQTVSVGEDVFNVYLKGNSGPIFYLLHGGGYSGLTWSCFVKALSERIECRVLAPDLRGHGDSRTSDDYQLSKETQIQDIADIFRNVYGEDDSPVCVIGHSMGGALAVHSVHGGLIPNVVGLIVIDVVEGSAMDALGGMLTFLRGRPTQFNSEEDAIKWCLKSGTTKNSRSARVSMPTQIVKADDDKFHWRIDLSRTSSHWPGWFEGLSSRFLQSTPPKMLVLAAVDRLDKELTIGQMQGKFQMTMLPRVGHAVHEDSPNQLADEIAKYAIRFRFAQAKGSSTAPVAPSFPVRPFLI